jgi:hypothetical protein
MNFYPSTAYARRDSRFSDQDISVLRRLCLQNLILRLSIQELINDVSKLTALSWLGMLAKRSVSCNIYLHARPIHFADAGILG